MLERKGFGIRLGAYAIDIVVMYVAILIVVAVTFAVPVVGGLLAMAVALAYPVIEAVKGQSPGKMALGLKIARADGAPAVRDQLVRRALVKWSPTIVSFGATALGKITGFEVTLGFIGSLASLGLGIALLAMSWSTLQTVRQAFWDLKANTAVFGKPAAVAAGFAPVMPPQPMPPVPGQPVPPVPGAVPAQA